MSFYTSNNLNLIFSDLDNKSAKEPANLLFAKRNLSYCVRKSYSLPSSYLSSSFYTSKMLSTKVSIIYNTFYPSDDSSCNNYNKRLTKLWKPLFSG